MFFKKITFILGVLILAFFPLYLYGFLDSVKEALQDFNEIHSSVKETHRSVKDTVQEVQQTADEVQGETPENDVQEQINDTSESYVDQEESLPIAADDDAIEFYTAINNIQEGPYDTNTLKQKIIGREIDKNTLVWKEGMNRWTKAGEVSELIPLFEACPPPLPPPLPPSLPQE